MSNMSFNDLQHRNISLQSLRNESNIPVFD